MSKDENRLVRDFLDEYVVMDLIKPIRELAIQIQSNHDLKVPDSSIAGTLFHLDFPFVTMDHDFKKVSELEAIILEH